MPLSDEELKRLYGVEIREQSSKLRYTSATTVTETDWLCARLRELNEECVDYKNSANYWKTHNKPLIAENARLREVLILARDHLQVAADHIDGDDSDPAGLALYCLIEIKRALAGEGKRPTDDDLVARTEQLTNDLIERAGEVR